MAPRGQGQQNPQEGRRLCITLETQMSKPLGGPRTDHREVSKRLVRHQRLAIDPVHIVGCLSTSPLSSDSKGQGTAGWWTWLAVHDLWQPLKPSCYATACPPNTKQKRDGECAMIRLPVPGSALHHEQSNHTRYGSSVISRLLSLQVNMAVWPWVGKLFSL